jgi:hypothetical protein
MGSAEMRVQCDHDVPIDTIVQWLSRESHAPISVRCSQI